MKYNKISRNFLLLTYKLLSDILLLALWSALAALMIEAVLPGFVSGRVSFLFIASIVLAPLLLLAFLGSYLDVKFAAHGAKRSILVPMFLVLSFLIVGNSMIKLPLWQNIILTLLLVLTFYNLYQILFGDKQHS